MEEPAGCSVLVVDDTPDIRDLVTMTLEAMAAGRFRVVGEAGDGRAAVEQARALRPDIVLLDLAMPIMDGLEALPEIRRVSPESKVLVLSGFNARELSDEAMAAGAAGYMEKGGITRRLVPRLLELLGPPAAPPEPPPLPPTAPGPDASPTLDIVSVLTHELLGPVTILQGYSALLTNALETMTPADIGQAAGAIGRATTQLTALVQSLADVKALELDALDLRLAPLDLGALVKEAIDDFGQLAESHVVEVDAPEGVIVTADEVRLRQVLLNLLSNAAKFSPPGSRITVGHDVTDSVVCLWVQDEGPGVPADRVGELFGKFARLGSSQKGTGIGLFLSRAIARAHGGDLVLAANTGGARFALELPKQPRG